MVVSLKAHPHRSSRENAVKLISSLAPWVQWLNMYALVAGVTVGYALVIFIDIIYFVFCRSKRKGSIVFATKQSRWIFRFMLAFSAMLPLGLLLANSTNFILIANRFIKLYAIYIMIIIMNDEQGLDWQAYRKSLEILVIFACAVIVYQYISNLLFGYFYDIRIPFLNYAREETNTLLTGISKETRFRSIFTEPCSFVYFIFQYLPILLFDEYEQRSLTFREFIYAGIITVCVVFSVSSTGLFLLAFVWGVFFVTLIRQGRITARGLAIGAVAIIGIVALAYFYLNNATVSFSMERLTNAYNQSKLVWWRLSAGYENVTEMTFWQKLCGYGMGNFPNDDFMNGISYTILCSGIIGLLIVALWMISNFFHSKLCGKVATIIWVLLIVTEIMALYAPTLIGYAIMVSHYQKGTTWKVRINS